MASPITGRSEQELTQLILPLFQAKDRQSHLTGCGLFVLLANASMADQSIANWQKFRELKGLKNAYWEAYRQGLGKQERTLVEGTLQVQNDEEIGLLYAPTVLDDFLNRNVRAPLILAAAASLLLGGTVGVGLWRIQKRPLAPHLKKIARRKFTYSGLALLGLEIGLLAFHFLRKQDQGQMRLTVCMGPSMVRTR